MKFLKPPSPPLDQSSTHGTPDTDTSASSLHHTIGAGANQVVAGNDARLTDARTPSNDSSLVHLTGNETINGNKSFWFPPTVVSNGTLITSTDTRLTNARTPSNDAALVHLSGKETISGEKIFNGGATINGGLMLGTDLAVTQGGTGSSVMPPPGSVIYGSNGGTAYGATGAGVAGQALVSGGAAAPAWEDITPIHVAVNASPPVAPAANDLWLVTDGVVVPAAKWSSGASSAPPASPSTNDLWLVTDVGASYTGGWAAYTPGQTGISLGNGSLVGAYQLIGKTLDFNMIFTYGSTSSWGTGDIVIYLPPGCVVVRGFTGSSNSYKVSTGYDYVGGLRTTAGGSAVVATANATFIASINGARPFLWATGDTLTITGRTEIA